MLTIVFFLAMTGFVVAVAIGLARRKELQKAKQRLIAQYQLNDVYVSHLDGGVIGFNFDARRIILGRKNIKAYDFAQIAAVEVAENDITVTQANRGSQLFGAAVGGLVLGPIGAVVGGLSGSTRSRDRLRHLSLKVTVDDRLQPVHTICFYQNFDKKGGNREGILAQLALQQVERFHGHIVNAIHQGRSNSGRTNSRVVTEPEVRGDVICAQCNTLLPSDAVFCRNCGTSTGSRTLVASTKACPNCRSESSPDATFCSKCGARLSPAALA